MPRPRKWRNVCALPDYTRFGPLGVGAGRRETVTMSIDEYEAIRLIDIEGFTQEMCAKQMNVARTTIQGMYEVARQKIADCLVNGRVLLIEGGEYHLCSQGDHQCFNERGCRHQRGRRRP